eukprot:gnl/TRDRNA2_/TRDRNA2_183909_c0_seq1.p1 gnl/TRDRNA2_/TRDRNA2_183909_c0~~gnl/TRDRNA2_/TRDRNA2_183909_c0_seq1.p1  ORF type:complete len:571 (+),score=172.54 gnl/TRDRNA2_/TRDRNA2_183909_c0_seq1:149-1861(+)
MNTVARMANKPFAVLLLFLCLFDSGFADDALELDMELQDTAAISLLQTRLEVQKKHIMQQKAHDTAADAVMVNDGESGMFPTCSADCADLPKPMAIEEFASAKEANTLSGWTPILLLLREVLLISLVCGIIYVVVEEYAFRADSKKPSNLTTSWKVSQPPQVRTKVQNDLVKGSRQRAHVAGTEQTPPFARLSPVPESAELAEDPAEHVAATAGHGLSFHGPPGLELPQDASMVKLQPQLPPPGLPPAAFIAPPPGLDVPEEAHKAADPYFDEQAMNFESAMIDAVEVQAQAEVEMEAEAPDDEVEAEAEEEQAPLEAEEDRQGEEEELEEEVAHEPEAPANFNVRAKAPSKGQKQKKPLITQQKVPPKKVKQPAAKPQPKKQSRRASTSETTKKSSFKWPMSCRTTLMVVTGFVVIVLSMIEVPAPQQDLPQKSSETLRDEVPEVPTKSTGDSGKQSTASVTPQKRDKSSSISKRRKAAVAKFKKFSKDAKDLLEHVTEDMNLDIPRIKKIRMNAKSLSITMQDVDENEFPEQEQFDQVFSKWRQVLDRAKEEVDSVNSGSCSGDTFKA